VYILLKADNNVPLVYYSAEDCATRDSVEVVAKALEYSTYAVMALSMSPAKIVGLELFGVLQLLHISLADINNVHPLLSPIANLSMVHGYNPKITTMHS
jgi:hypothetical protein